jgi:hypothetical protein
VVGVFGGGCLLACSLALSVCMAEEDKGTTTKNNNNNRGAVFPLMEYWV